MRIKINWGTAIVIAFALFMSFILFFVFKVQSDHKYDNELVSEEYYKKEATVQNDINSEHNANALSQQLAVTYAAEGITINFPKDLDYKKIKGTVSLYRPSNKKLDFAIPIALSNSDLLIPKKNLVGGLWDITIQWTYDGKSYLNKEELYYQ
jgi:hypothetical protein